MSLKLEKALPGAMLGWGGKFVSLSFWCFGQTSWNQCFIRADSAARFQWNIFDPLVLNDKSSQISINVYTQRYETQSEMMAVGNGEYL